MISSTSPVTRIAALDGLRGLACLMVFAVHFGQITQLDGGLGPFDLGRLLANGNTGVALFFVLTGFLLSLPFWEARVHGLAPPFGRYLSKRAGRIVPAYFICLTGLIILNRHWQKSDGWLDAALHYAFVFNYAEWSIFSINPPFWTLAVEMQFYLVLPLLFLLTTRADTRVTVACVIVLALSCYLGHAALVELTRPPGVEITLSPVLSYSLLAHMPHFLIGVLAANVYLRISKPTVFRPLLMDTTAWLALLTILLIISTPLDTWLQIPHGRYNLPFVPLLLAALVCAAPLAPFAGKVFDAWPLRLLGLISYGIYIYHLPILQFTARNMGALGFDPKENWALFGFSGFMLTVVVSVGSYLLVERPILLRLKQSGAAKPRGPMPSASTAR